MARSTRDLLNLLGTIAEKGARFRSLRDTRTDTTTAHGRLMLTVLGGLAEFERELIRTRTGEGRERPAHAARVGAGEVGACDQRIGRQRAPLIGPQRLALPFARLALGSVQPRPRHFDLDRPECPAQRPRPAAVAAARQADITVNAARLACPVARP